MQFEPTVDHDTRVALSPYTAGLREGCGVTWFVQVYVQSWQLWISHDYIIIIITYATIYIFIITWLKEKQAI